MKKRILFVDDDKQLLSSLKRMLWNAQDRWEMRFALSGKEALGILAQTPHDVVVADMRMPAMDGRGLLKEVRKLYPWILRLILSGESNRDNIMRSIPEAHQFLTKPVSSEGLMNVIERGCQLRDMILSDEIKAIVGNIDTLPTQPGVYNALLAILDDEDSSVDDVAAVIIKDVALSADILKLVNSSFFGPRIRVRSLGQAVNLLGMETIKGLVLGLQLLRMFDTKKLPSFSFTQLWEHSLAVAKLARLISITEGLPAEEQDESFIAGMLHDLGKFVLADKLTEAYQRVVETSRQRNEPIYSVEGREFGADHTKVGAYLLGLWGLPDTVLEAVAFHHAPSAIGHKGMTVMTAVHVANALEHELVVIHPEYAKQRLDMNFLAESGLAAHLETWTRIGREALMVEDGS